MSESRAPEDVESSDGLDSSETIDQRHKEYWRRNLRILGVLLAIWFVASFGCGILWVETLNQFHLPGTGFKLGFWFAQQGSIYVFVVLVFVYAFLMNGLDKEFGVSEE
ncbi:MAG: putative solute:sodium symporter small subunit [Planctomycetota bacterium]|jgi:putative solute:sodium symporter small subunit